MNAKTPEEKRAIIERILTVWIKYPHLRFGQLIANATNERILFYEGDKELVENVEQFGKDNNFQIP